MNKLQLPNVTLLCVDCVDVDRAIAIVEHCKTMVDFGAVKVISNQERNYPIVKISPLNTLIMYSVWMLTECHKYIDTDLHKPLCYNCNNVENVGNNKPVDYVFEDDFREREKNNLNTIISLLDYRDL
jgi:hypothetical protein